MQNETKFNELMAAMAEVFDKEITESLLSVYWQVLEPYQDIESISALNKCLLSCKFFPKPADLLEQLQGNNEDLALIAWGKVDYAIRHIGGNSSVVFDDPVIHLALEAMGGWHDTNEWQERDMTWKRKEFLATYHAQKHSGRQPSPYLQGSTEIQQRAQGYTSVITKPKQIGEIKASQHLISRW